MSNRSKASLGLFLKEPVAGAVKTRLAPALGADGAASIYSAFIDDTLTLALHSVARHIHLFVAGSIELPLARSAILDSVDAARSAQRLDLQPQSTGDLGDRLRAAFHRAFEAETLPLLILGTDSPDLPLAYVDQALGALDSGAEVVLGSAADGGVWCIGLANASPKLFEAIPWSRETTGEALRNRADALGLKRFEAPPWFDCDTADDLRALTARLRQNPTRAMMTQRWLAHQAPADFALDLGSSPTRDP